MNINDTLQNTLNVNPHEKKRVLLLILKSFFLGIYISYFFSFANGAFLSEFSIGYIPYAYIVSGILGFLFSTVFVMIQKKVKIFNLLVGALMFDLLLTLFFVAGFNILANTKWLIFFVFISVGPIFSLINVSFWTLATSLFDLREGKRLFGLLGSGSVISSILGYFSIPIVIQHIGDSSNLMLIGIIGLVLGILVQWIIMTRLPEAKVIQSGTKKKTKGPGLSLKEIFNNKYFNLIFLVVIFSMIVQYFVDYNFMGIAREYTQDKTQLTAFFGVFFGLVKVVELLFRTLAAGRLMSKYGMILGLLLLPVLLLGFTLIALGGNLFISGLEFLLLLFAMIKLIDKVVRRSMEEPAVKTLYQPVDSKTKLLLQTSIEGKGKQLAVIIAGIILMLFNLIPSFTIIIAAIISCLLIVVWMVYARKTYNEYRVILNKQLTAPIDHEEDTKLTRNGNYFSLGMSSENQTTFGRSVAAIHKLKPDALIPYYPDLLNHSNDSIRLQTVKWLNKYPLLSFEKQIENQLAKTENLEHKEVLREVVDKIKSINKLSENDMNRLVRSEANGDRIKAAAWICHNENENTAHFLDTLLKDINPDVVQATCFYISNIKNHTFLKSLLNHIIENKSYEHSVLKDFIINSSGTEDILNISFNKFSLGDKYVLLEEAFSITQNEPVALLVMINKLGLLENEHSIEFLKNKLNISNWGVQYFVLKNLKRLGYSADENDLASFRQLILKETSFCTWIIATKNDLNKGEHFPELVASLDEQLAASKNKIFNILSYLYPADAIANIQNNILSGIVEKEVMALEMADILLDEIHKDIIFPLFDKISLVEKIKNLSQHFPQAVMNQEERLKNIIFFDYAMLNNVTKAFAVEALNTKSQIIPFEITAQIYGKDLLLKQTAYTEIYRQNETIFKNYIGKENAKTRLQLIKTLSTTEEQKGMLSRLEIVRLLKDLPLFKSIEYWKLSLIDSFFDPLVLKANESYNRDGLNIERVQIFITGSLILLSRDGTEINVKSGDLIGFYDESIFERDFIAQKDSILLSISKSDFHLILEGFPTVSQDLYNLFIDEDYIGNEEQDEVNDLFLEYAGND